MRCSKCRDTAILFQPYSGQHLCRDHLIADIEAKAKREIRRNMGIRPGDRIGVLAGSGIQERALLFFLQKLTENRRDIQIVEIPLDAEGDRAIEQADDFGITRIARAIPLEDRAAASLTAILTGEVEQFFTPATTASGRIPVITPFCHVPAEEIALYGRLNGIQGELTDPGQRCDALFTDVRTLLADYTRRHPAAPHAVQNLTESLSAVSGSEKGREAMSNEFSGRG